MALSMKINNSEYGFTIEPRFGKVLAEIYKFSENKILGDSFHIHLISKEFGSIFRKPIEKDYLNARNWVELQMKFIEESNKELK
jgi:hypothetical protein